MKLEVIFYDCHGNEVDSYVGGPAKAAQMAAKFILLQGSDPDEDGAGATSGRVEFRPIAEA